MTFLRTLALLAFSVPALSACATDRTYAAAEGIEMTDLTELPQPAGGIGFGLRPFDTLAITVLQDEALNGTYQVDSNGQIDFPYIGSVTVAGLRPTDVPGLLKARLSPEYVRNPEIIVRASDVSLQTISMGGEVSRPGNYPVRESPTLMRAINTAGGSSEYADLDDVLVFREVAGTKYIGLYNLKAIQRGNYPDPQMAPGDVVMVGYSPARRRLETIFQYLPLLTTSIVLIDRVGS